MDDMVLTELLSRYSGLELAILFGSLSNGRAGFDSDLDLAVLFDKPLSAELKLQLIADLAQCSGRSIDLIDLRSAGVPLVGQVLKGNRVFGSVRAHGELLARYLKDAADFLPLIERGLKQRRERWIHH